MPIFLIFELSKIN